MLYFKKLIFGLPFILAVAAFAWQIEPFLQDFSLLFSFNFNLLYQTIMLVATIAMVAYLFTVFAVLASDWILVLPVIIIACLFTIIFVTAPMSFFLAIGLLVIFAISFAQTYNKVTKNPTSFHVSGDVVKPSGFLITLIILVASITLYFSVSASSDKAIQKIIDSVVSISSGIMKTQQLPQNTAAQDLALEAAKPMITKQVTDMIKPLRPAIPFLVVFYFYLNFQFLASIAAFFLSPLIYLLFWILQKTKFFHFEVEMRQVNKLVV